MISVSVDMMPMTVALSASLGSAMGMTSIKSLHHITDAVSNTNKNNFGKAADKEARSGSIAHVYTWTGVDDEYFGETAGNPKDRLWDMKVSKTKIFGNEIGFAATITFKKNKQVAPIPPLLQRGAKSRHIFQDTAHRLESFKNIRSTAGRSKSRITDKVPKFLYFVEDGTTVKDHKDKIKKYRRPNHYHRAFEAFLRKFYLGIINDKSMSSNFVVPAKSIASVIQKETKAAEYVALKTLPPPVPPNIAGVPGVMFTMFEGKGKRFMKFHYRKDIIKKTEKDIMIKAGRSAQSAMRNYANRYTV